MAERKKYIEINVPLLNSNLRVLGTPEELHNKTIKIDMTRKMRGKGLTITFRIFNNEGTLTAIPNKMELVKSYIRRSMRKRTDYVEDSFKTNSADVPVTIKPLLITRKRVSRAVRKNLRNTAREYLTEYVKEKDYNDLCEEIKIGILQKSLLPKLKKVYPLSFCDIRVFETKQITDIDINKIIEKTKEKQTQIEQENTDNEENDDNEQESSEQEEEKTENEKEENDDNEEGEEKDDNEKEGEEKEAKKKTVKKVKSQRDDPKGPKTTKKATKKKTAKKEKDKEEKTKEEKE